jgi:hypothetical protein
MALQRTSDSRRGWFVGLSIASAVGVALALLRSEGGLSLFGVLSVVPLIPLIGLRLKSTAVRSKVLLATGIVFFVWVWGFFAVAALLEPLALIALLQTLAVVGFPLSILLLVLLSMLKAEPANGKGAI